MKNFDFGIRVDAGDNIGFGHYFRCIALAEELKKRKKSVIFIISNKKNQMNEKKQFPHIILKGRTENKKIQECKNLMNKIKCLIIDLPEKEEDYGKELQSQNVVIINDLGNQKVYSKILINGSIVKKFHNYEIKNKIAKIFIDSKYMIIRKKFLIERQKKKIKNKSKKNILLTFGGTDEKNYTLKILPLLLKKQFNITIVIGPSNKNKHEINKLIKKKFNINLIINPNNIAKLFSKQDLIISSSGITIYELACLGIPSLIIPVNNPQRETALEMEKRGFGKILNLQTLNEKNFDKILVEIQSKKTYKKMASAGMKIIDGKGTERITDILEKSIK